MVYFSYPTRLQIHRTAIVVLGVTRQRISVEPGIKIGSCIRGSSAKKVGWTDDAMTEKELITVPLGVSKTSVPMSREPLMARNDVADASRFAPVT
jgi:hypothetical protein